MSTAKPRRRPHRVIGDRIFVREGWSREKDNLRVQALFAALGGAAEARIIPTAKGYGLYVYRPDRDRW